MAKNKGGRPRKFVKVPVEAAAAAGLASPEELETRPDLAAVAPDPGLSAASSDAVVPTPDPVLDLGAPVADQPVPSSADSSASTGAPGLPDLEPPHSDPSPPKPARPPPGSGPRPRRKKAPEVEPVAQADAKTQVAAMLAGTIQSVGYALAKTLDPCWELSEGEAQQATLAINVLLPEVMDEKTLAWITLAGIFGPRVITTAQNKIAARRKARAPLAPVIQFPIEPAPAPPPPPVPKVEERPSISDAWVNPDPLTTSP